MVFPSKDIIENKPVGSDFPILTIVQKYLNTVSRGSGHWAVCPFHQDTAPSLSVSVPKNIFKCFACNASGNAINFVMKIEKCGYVEAVRKIGEILEMDVSKYLNQKQNKLYELCKFNEYVAEHYHKYLFNKTNDSVAALNYLTVNRKLKLETINRYRIGFSPKENTLETIIDIYKSQNHNIDQEIIWESNLYSHNTKSINQIPFFRNRIIFPIMNEDGNVIGFSGRGENPKYLNLRNNRLFSKANSLFNIQYLVADKPIYLFEGFIDLLKVGQELGIENGIACMGGILNSSTFPVIRKYSNQIILCLDNDEAGKKFTVETGKLLISAGFEVLVANFLDRKEKDVDEMIEVNPNLIKTRMEDPVQFLEWMHMHRCPENLSDTKKLVDECLGIFLDVNNYSLKENIDLNYAIFLIELVFAWYKRHKDKWSYIETAVNEKKSECIKGAERSEIRGGPRKNLIEEAKKEYQFSQLDSFQKIALRFYALLRFVKDEEMQVHNPFEWRYRLRGKFYKGEMEWFLESLENPNEEYDIPEFINKYKDKIQEIKNDREFFNNYYSFYQEYLEAWGEEEFENYCESLPNRLKSKWGARNEIEELKKVSSRFFAKFKKTHPVFTDNN